MLPQSRSRAPRARPTASPSTGYRAPSGMQPCFLAEGSVRSAPPAKSLVMRSNTDCTRRTARAASSGVPLDTCTARLSSSGSSGRGGRLSSAPSGVEPAANPTRSPSQNARPSSKSITSPLPRLTLPASAAHSRRELRCAHDAPLVAERIAERAWVCVRGRAPAAAWRRPAATKAKVIASSKPAPAQTSRTASSTGGGAAVCVTATRRPGERARYAGVPDHPAHLLDEVLRKRHVAPEVRRHHGERGPVLLDGEPELRERRGHLGRVDWYPEQVAGERAPSASIGPSSGSGRGHWSTTPPSTCPPESSAMSAAARSSADRREPVAEPLLEERRCVRTEPEPLRRRSDRRSVPARRLEQHGPGGVGNSGRAATDHPGDARRRRSRADDEVLGGELAVGAEEVDDVLTGVGTPDDDLGDLRAAHLDEPVEIEGVQRLAELVRARSW